MLKHSACIALLSLVIGAAWLAAQQPGGPPMTIDEQVAAYRADLQANRADVIRQQITLTSAQALKFWPMFDQFQQEQSAIMDEQMRGIQTYISNSETMDDGSVRLLIDAHLDRDANMAALRKRYFAEFQTVLTMKQAARVIQVDRRLGLAHQLEFTQQIPLVK